MAYVATETCYRYDYILADDDDNENGG